MAVYQKDIPGIGQLANDPRYWRNRWLEAREEIKRLEASNARLLAQLQEIQRNAFAETREHARLHQGRQYITPKEAMELTHYSRSQVYTIMHNEWDCFVLPGYDNASKKRYGIYLDSIQLQNLG